MANFTRQQIADACRQYGPTVAPLPFNGLLPASVDGTQLLWAISGNESSFGADCTPRHEPAFDVGGVYAAMMAPLLAVYGSAAACSYGPLQLMFCNAPSSASPADFDDLSTAFRYSVAFLNRLLGRFHPQNLAQIGECWNGGHPMVIPPPQVAAYVQRLAANYQVPMPE